MICSTLTGSSLSQVNFEIDERPLSLSIPSELDYIGRQICCAVYEPLLRYHCNSDSFFPAAADHWELSKESLVYTFYLKPDRCWSNGLPVQAEHFLNTFIRTANHPYWGRHFIHVKSASAESDFTFRIELREKVNFLLHMLATVDFSPVWDAETAEERADRGPFNGPYILRDIEPGVSYGLDSNVYYPGASYRPPIKLIVQRVPSRSTMLYDSEEIHVTCNTAFPFNEIEARRLQPGFRTAESSIYMQLEINAECLPQLMAPEFRLALFLALDRSAIADALYQGVRPSSSFGPSSFKALATTLPKTPNIDVAQSLLKNFEKPTRPLVIHYNDYVPNRFILEQIQKQWEQTLDIKTELVAIDFDEVTRTDFDLLLTLRFPTFPHPYVVLEQYNTFLGSLTTTKNQTYFANILERIRSGSTINCKDMYRSAAAFLTDMMPVLPLFDILSFWMIHQNVVGFEYPQDGNFDFREIRWRI